MYSQKSLTATRFLSSAMIVLATITLSGCEKEKSHAHDDTTGHVEFTVTNKVDSADLELGRMIYSTAEGNTYQIDLLKYFISNITFIKEDGTTYNAGNYDLVNEEISSSKDISLTGIPKGTYTGIRFNLGVDSARNNDLANVGDLDPATGMFWPWNTGYIFFMAEGSFITSSGATNSLRHHYGGEAALVVVELPIDLTVNNDHRHVDLEFNLNSLFNSPNPIDLDIDNDRQSFSSDRTWIEAMKGNFPGSFNVTGVH